MKKLVALICIGLLLCGCAAETDFETVSDVYEPELVPAMQIVLTLPGETAVTAMSEDRQDKLYFMDDYCVTVQTLEAGDLDKTIRSVSGYPMDALTVMEQTQGDLRRYDFVWSCAGEGGDQVGRASILDDGSYHYVLTAMADADRAGSLEDSWQSLFGSFTVG